MKFNAMLLDYEGIRPATIEDLRAVHEKHSEIYCPEGQKNLYVIETEIIDNRFFWLACEYEDTEKFRDYVIDLETGEKQQNPRTQKQIEPRQQFFACYDDQRKRLFISSLNVKAIFKRILDETAQKDFHLRNIYASVDDFCARVKTINTTFDIWT